MPVSELDGYPVNTVPSSLPVLILLTARMDPIDISEKKVGGKEGTIEPNNLSDMGQQSHRHYKPLAMTCKYSRQQNSHNRCP